MFFACQEYKREYETIEEGLRVCPFCGTPGKVYCKVLDPLKEETIKYRIVTGCPNPKCKVQPHVVIVRDYFWGRLSFDIHHTIEIWEGRWEGRWDGVKSLNSMSSDISKEDDWIFEDVYMTECPWCHEKARVGWNDYYKILNDGSIRHSYNVVGGCFNPDCKIGHTICEWGGLNDDTRDGAIKRIVHRWNMGGEYK